MSETEQLAEARRILGWVFHRTRHGCSSSKRSERDKALSDVNYWTEKYREHWEPGESRRGIDKNRIWFGEGP